MEYVGIDVHKKQSQICPFTAAGEVLRQRIDTQRERFAAVFAGRPTAHILIEAATESAWVAQCLEALAMRSSRPTPTTRRCMPSAVKMSFLLDCLSDPMLGCAKPLRLS